MFIKVNSSRDTSVGLFRAGLVYDLSKASHKALAAVKPHLKKGGAFEELSDKDAKQAASVAVKVIGPAEASPEPVAPEKSGKAQKA